jgi:hypothetical protein
MHGQDGTGWSRALCWCTPAIACGMGTKYNLQGKPTAAVHVLRLLHPALPWQLLLAQAAVSPCSSWCCCAPCARGALRPGSMQYRPGTARRPATMHAYTRSKLAPGTVGACSHPPEVWIHSQAVAASPGQGEVNLKASTAGSTLPAQERVPATSLANCPGPRSTSPEQGPSCCLVHAQGGVQDNERQNRLAGVGSFHALLSPSPTYTYGCPCSWG